MSKRNTQLCKWKKKKKWLFVMQIYLRQNIFTWKIICLLNFFQSWKIVFVEAKCTLDNINFYPEGAYWNPVQDTQKIGAGCVNCTCSNVSFLQTNSQFYTQLTSFKRQLARASAPLSSIWREAASCRREIVRKSASSRCLFERLFFSQRDRGLWHKFVI